MKCKESPSPCTELTLRNQKEHAETAYRKTAEKTVGLGQRLDIVFTLIRLGFMHDDKDLVVRNIEKGKRCAVQLGGGRVWRAVQRGVGFGVSRVIPCWTAAAGIVGDVIFNVPG